MLFVDIEADSLNPTKIHCVAIGTIDGTVDLYSGASLPVAYGRLRSASVLVGHNAICYDYPVLERLASVPRTYKPVDTLVCSSLLWPDIEGGHSLEAWGVRLGYPKMDYLAEYKAWKFATEADWVYEEGEEWREYNPVMGKYCKRDVEVLIKLWHHIKKELDQHDWKMALRLEHKIAEIMHQQAVDGWQFDVEKAKGLLTYIDSEVQQIDSELEKVINRKCKKKGVEVSAPFKKDGGYKASVIDWYGEEDSSYVAGPFNRVEWEFPNLNSRDQLADLFLEAGWTPTKFTETGKPKLDKDTLEELAEKDLSQFGPVVQLLVKKAAYVKRRGLLKTRDEKSKEKKGLLDNVRPDGRISAIAIPHGTKTGRMAHRVVANIPKAEQSVLLGKEIRECFITRPGGRILVGADAAGIQLRLLAHYMNDPDFIHALINGVKWETDAHSLAAIDAGLDPRSSYVIDGKGGAGRDIGKTINYALIFRAGADRMGGIIGKGPKDGQNLKDKLFSRMPAYPKLVRKVEQTVESRGYLIGLDGRKVTPTDSYKGLVEMIQGAEAICMKVAICKMKQLWQKKRLDAILVGTYHDEIQSDALEEHGMEAGKCLDEGLKYATQLFRLRCPLEGEIKLGKDWSITH